MKKIFFLLVIFSLISCLQKKEKNESKSELKDYDLKTPNNNKREFVIEYNAPPSPPKEVMVEKKIEDSFKEEISLLKEKLKEIKKVSEKKNESLKEKEDGGEKSTKITQFVWERKKMEEKEEVKEKNFDYRNQPYYDNGKINNQKFISIVRDPNNGSITTEFKGRKFYFKHNWEKRQFESIINNLK